MNNEVDAWCLKSLFKDNKELDDFVSILQNRAIEFEKKYSSKLNAFIEDKDNFDAVIKEYEDICESIGRIATYTFLLFAKDTSNGAFYAKYELITNNIESNIIFFELELAKLDDYLLDLCIANSKRYSYFLLKLKENRQYKLSKEQEQVLIKISPTAASAFSRFFDEYMSKLKFDFEDRRISEEEILSKLHDSNREVRKKAQKELTKKLKYSSHILQYIINIIRKDLRISKELRGYASLESFRHISNQISQKSVDSMIDVVVSNFDLVSRYYNIKSRILGVNKLKDYDRYAPISEGNEDFDYDKAKSIVIETFMDFSRVCGEIVERAFRESWVDSHPKDNKRGGAFSHGSVPSSHPYVLLNYTGKRRDVFTIAHEFGHAIHQELSKSAGYLNMDTPLTTAETASVFGEMLLFDKMKQNIKGKKELIGLYAGKIEDIFATLFRQVVMTNFERRIHNIEGELDSATLNSIWLEENKKMFGKSLKLTKKYAFWWSYIPHFIHSPFYCYAYSYGQLLSLALFGLYKSGHDGFVDKYVQFLSYGGSRSPKDLVGIFGFDIEDTDFWQYGINEIIKILDEFSVIVESNNEI